MADVLRILDANFNRAREALRVMEESSRFLLGDEALTARLKRLRHALSGAMSVWPGLEAGRDTPGDVGTTIKTERELTRHGAADVCAAAGKRLSEALRAIEEYAKTLPAPGGGDADRPAAASVVESLRYEGYDVEQRLNRAMAGGRPGRQWRLCVLLTERLCVHRPWREVAREALGAGADCVQLREKEMEGGELLRRARELVAMARELSRDGGATAASVIVNDRPDVAMLSGADGVHLGQTDLPCEEVRRLVGRQLLIGVSTSELAMARRAMAAGADYCGVGPMFMTTTKKKDVIVGPEYLREYVAWGKLPHLAIGGVSAANAGELVTAGAGGVAVSSAVCGAADPGQAVRDLLAAMNAATGGR